MNSSKLRSHLAKLYGKGNALPLFEKILQLIKDKKTYNGEKFLEIDETSIALITYGDIVSAGNEPPLKTLRRLLNRHLKEVVSIVHLLPFFPYSSDDGFSVIDYRKVDNKLGTWKDVRLFRTNFHLVFDAVFNHISAKSEWFRKYLANNEKYRNFFIEIHPDENLSKTVRPRSLPVLNKFRTSGRGEKYLWTTFSRDQIDLNYKNPEVLIEMIDILLSYIQNGAEIIRLDAVAFLWKEPGTSCIHLEETHTIVKIFRMIMDETAPGTIMLTETNVPHEKNISYFGDNDEASMVYQFSLAPLTIHAVLSENAEYLTDWADSIKEPDGNCTFFNLIASHDGIGLLPANGILPEKEIQKLVDKTLEKGGMISFRRKCDDSESPYELNISLLSLFMKENCINESISRFMLSQSVMLSMPGIPAIYFHSLFGSLNYYKGVEETGINRTINREKLNLKTLEKELSDPFSIRCLVFHNFIKMLKARKTHKSFHPKSGFNILKLEKRIFCIVRGTETGYKNIILIHNFSASTVKVNIPADIWHHPRIDLLSGNNFESKQIEVPPLSIIWLS